MKIKIVNKKKFIRGIIILAIFIMILFLLISKVYSKGELKYKVEYIANGDTLWAIALHESTINKYYEEKDIRKIVQDIKSLNSIENDNLYIGQKILIPTI